MSMELFKIIIEGILALCALLVIAERFYIRRQDKKEHAQKSLDMVNQQFRDAVSKYFIDENDRYLEQIEVLLGRLCMYQTIEELKDLKGKDHAKFESRLKELSRKGIV